MHKNLNPVIDLSIMNNETWTNDMEKKTLSHGMAGNPKTCWMAKLLIKAHDYTRLNQLKLK